MKQAILSLLVSLVLTPAGWAQHEEHTKKDTTRAEPPDMHAHTDMHRDEMPEMDMSSMLLPSLPMARDGSGTSWVPDTSPMHAVHTQMGDWSVMLHGVTYLRYTAQDVFESGQRGDAMLDAPNWFMAMTQRKLGRTSQVALRSMVSLEPITVGGNGYPLLFQTGETFEGEPLIDRQHPHDLFMELAAIYGQDLGRNAGIFAYFGYPGEPALGPPAFLHRPSGIHNPDAALGHHWQDATHITFGVATLGLRFGAFKLDGSLFTGREPDEERYGFDRPRFDSYSARLAANPNEYLSLQVSRGFLKSPEVLEPEEDVWRTTAAVLFNNPIQGQGNWAAMLLWGMNEPEDEEILHTLLAESDLQIGRQVYYTRLEWAQRPAHDLGLEAQFGDHRTFNIPALTLGLARDLMTFGSLDLMLGAHGSFHRVPEALHDIYGSSPISLQVFLRLSPKLRMGGGMHGAGTHDRHQM